MPDIFTGASPDTATVTLWLLHIAAAGQTLFMLMWMTLPWWRAWVGRALMVKSVAMGLFLVSAVVHHHVDTYAWEPVVVLLLFAGVTLGIWSQVLAIGLEIRAARRGSRNVTGTDDLKVSAATPEG